MLTENMHTACLCNYAKLFSKTKAVKDNDGSS